MNAELVIFDPAGQPSPDGMVEGTWTCVTCGYFFDAGTSSGCDVSWRAVCHCGTVMEVVSRRVNAP